MGTIIPQMFSEYLIPCWETDFSASTKGGFVESKGENVTFLSKTGS